ncbi:unnamed protein product [Ixodes pacificus]
MQPGLFKVDVESKMISLVEKRRFLWDVRDRSYHKRDLKERAYAEIAAALGRQFTAAAVKSRFANLRSQYHREQRRVTDSLKSASSPEDVYVPRWTHYTKLQFLQTSSPRQGRWPAPDNQDASEVAPEAPEDILSAPWVELKEGSFPINPSVVAPEDAAGHCSFMGGRRDSTDASSTRSASTSGELAGASSSFPDPSPGGRDNKPTKRRRSADDGYETERKLHRLLESAVQTLTETCEGTKKDDCDAFGALMAQTARQLPQGPHRQMGTLKAYEALVSYSVSVNERVVGAVQKLVNGE